MKQLFCPRTSLLLITLPQLLLAGAMVFFYRSAQLAPITALAIVYGAQALLNGFVIVCAVTGRSGKTIRILQLAGFLLVLSAATPFLLQQFHFGSSLSPEAIYGTLCLIPLIYIAASILHHNEIPLPKVQARIALCVGIPLLASLGPLFLFSGLFDDAAAWAENTDWRQSAASVILILLFALFFLLVCLLVSILHHFRSKAAAGSDSPQGPLPKQPTAGYYALIVLLALVLPLLCLYLNNEAFFGIVGDFSGPWFYLLAVVNAAAMLLPRKNKWLTLTALFVKSAGFLYVCYFAVTMLRFAPLGVAFYAYLVPALVLTPFALFTAELFQLIDDFRFLRQFFSLGRISAVLVCGMLCLCGGFLGNGYVQKVNFDNAKCYLNSEAEVYPQVNLPMLRSSLRYLHYAPSVWDQRSGNPPQSLEGAPILSEVYHRLIFGGEVLEAGAYAQLQRIFFPEDATHWQAPPDAERLFLQPESVTLQALRTDTRFDEREGVYKTWVHLDLQNTTELRNQEYVLQFTLPEGVFVSGYYLDVLGERKEGIVAEKNAAVSLYQSIVSRNRDPGLICYTRGRTVELRVFPFEGYETRQTGFELMFLQSDAFALEEYQVTLEGDSLQEPVVAGGVCFMPGEYKANLEAATKRTPQYYFVADARVPRWAGDPTLEDTLEQIRSCAQRLGVTQAPVYLTSYFVETTDLSQLHSAGYGEGGFHLARAMELIYQAAKEDPDHYPVVVVASGNLYNAAMASQHSLLHDFPETAYYYLIGSAGELLPHRLSDGFSAEDTNEAPQANRLHYKGFYFRDDGQSELAYRYAADDAPAAYGSEAYRNAMLLSEKVEKALTKEQVIETVRDGILQRVLTKHNSFIVLETKEQQEELERRNQAFLEGGELAASAAAMHEPGLLAALLLTLLLGALLLKKRRRDPRAPGHC